MLVGIVVLGLIHPKLITPATAYTIDGSLLDWGVGLSAANSKGYLDTHLPSGGLDIDVITEDNAASNIYGWQYVGPGYSYGNNKSWSPYYKKGNSFDVEAIYFDNDQYNAYIAVVQGLPITGGTAPGNPWFYPGDIGLNLNNDSVYEFGIDVREYDVANKKAKLLRNLTASNWRNVYYSRFSVSNPWEIIPNSKPYYWIDFVYSANQNSHYVMEAAIPLSYLGLSANPGDPIYPLKIHWTQQCGNDYLNLSADVNPIPEPSSLALLVIGLFGLAGFSLR